MNHLNDILSFPISALHILIIPQNKVSSCVLTGLFLDREWACVKGHGIMILFNHVEGREELSWISSWL